MIRILIASDDLDVRLGGYFKACKGEMMTVINAEIDEGKSLHVEEILPNNCNNAYINIKYAEFKEIPFIWVSYSHGNENSIMVNGSSLISAGDDNSIFSNTLFYTNSCLSGKFLGPDLINQNCRSFIGYDQSIVAFKNENQEISLKCDNVGLISFLTADVTAYDAFNDMKKYYTQQANRLLDLGDILSSGLLINAREALVFHGDESLKKTDLFFENE